MRYGYFDDDAREYVILTPRTPYPWINYLGNEDFFSIISNTAGGYSFYRDARLRRITRYRYNNVPLDSGGRYFYIIDGSHIWNPGWQPMQVDPDHYECRHGLGYTRIKSSFNDLQAELLFFVPLGAAVEIQHLRLTNHSKEPKSLKLYSLTEFCLWNALDDQTNFQRNFSTGEVEIDGSSIYHKTEFRERRNHYAFYSVNREIQGFDTDRESFLGLYNGYDKPDAVLNGGPRNSECHGWSPIASHYIELELAAGETQDFIFLLGYAELPQEEKWASHGVINKSPAKEIQSRFTSPEDIDRSWRELHSYWDDLLGIYQVTTADERLNRMVNIWNPYQCMVTFHMSRSASYFESGIGRGMGFRDSNQDLIGFVHQIPQKARQRILDLGATMFRDGSAYHQYQPLTKRGNAEIGSNFNDDPLWIVLSVSSYIKETGDWRILDEIVPFENDEELADTLLEHLRRAIKHVVENLGPHGLPLIGRADWNDCLNLNCFSTNPDEPFQTTENRSGRTAESLMIAGAFVLYAREYAQLCKRSGHLDESNQVLDDVAEMSRAIGEHGWDGEWFLRAYDFFGEKVGSAKNEEGRIFIESQGFCVMAGLGRDDGRARQALDSVKKYLDCEQGIVLNNPPFTKYYLSLGEISTYPEGYKENAGVFCHNNPWIMIAETVLGNGDQAYEYYRKIAPSYLEENWELHKTEPYVYAQMIAGKDAFRPGEAKNSWLTGTASWNFYAISQYILGIRPDFDGLRVDPCIPKDWNQFKVKRRYRNANYNITIENPDGVSHGVREIIFDGNSLSGNILPALGDNQEHDVKVILGPDGSR